MKRMKRSKRRVSFGLFYAVTLLPLCGCVETLALLSVPVTAIQLGAMAYQSVEKTEISATVTSGVTENELQKIKDIAILLGPEDATPPSEKIHDLKAVVGDNLNIQLTKVGFRVCDGSRLKKSTLRNLAKTGYTIEGIVQAGRTLGVQAVVTGNITGAQHRSFGMLGVGRMNTIVQSASMKVVGVEKGDTLIVVTANYRVGQNPGVVAKGIALILKEKLENPKPDVVEARSAETPTKTDGHAESRG